MIGLLLAMAVPAQPAGVDLVFPGSTRLAVEVVGVGDGWGGFLDALFDHFDRDADGTLSAAEAARVFPLPLPDGRTVGSKAGTKAAFRERYRATGFAPVVGVVRPPTDEQRRLTAALVRHLDRNADGELSREELATAPGLLRRFDENEDERLTPGELLVLGPVGPPTADRIAMSVETPCGEPDGVLKLTSGEPGQMPRMISRFGFFTPAAAMGSDTSGGRIITAGSGPFAVPGGQLIVAPPKPTAGFAPAAEFFRSQFTDALGGKPALTKADLDAADLPGLAGMVAAADRDGDGRLTAGELNAFLALVERGVGCQVRVMLECGGLFDLLDTDADGRLDGAELQSAKAVGPVRRDAIPGKFRLTADRGPVAPTFGPVPVPTASAKPPSRPAADRVGPAWFRAMDRNGDGFVSAAEWLGPPDRFASLDQDRNGRLSPTEADRR